VPSSHTHNMMSAVLLLVSSSQAAPAVSNDTYCCTSCAAGGCSAFYSPRDVGAPYACSKGEEIVAIPGHGNTCKAKSSMSLRAAHVYTATYTNGPQPAVRSSCVAYGVQPTRDWLNLQNGFSASAGGEVWAHDSIVFTLAGGLTNGQSASLRFANVTASRAPFMLRISTPTVAPADALTFEASDDAACPSEHCLMPDVTKTLPPGKVNTPTCGFGTVGSSVVDQPISPNAPAGTPLQVDVTALISKGARYLKVTVLPEHSSADGFWDSQLQVSGAQIVVH